jgi:general secretion pathway protein C
MQIKTSLFRNKAVRRTAVQWSGQGASSRLLTGLLLALWCVFGAVLIHWVLQLRALSWVATSPDIAVRSVEMGGAPAAGRNLALPPLAYVLGAKLQGDEPAGEEPPASNTPNVQLLGVLMNGSGARAGVALLAVEGQPARVFRLGQEATPGWQLARIEAKQVTLKQNAAPLGERVVALSEPTPRDAPLGVPPAPGPDAMLQPDVNPPIPNPENGGVPAATRRFLPRQP